MSKLFNITQSPKINRNKFDLSHDVKTSLNAGELVPILCKPVIPGDHFRINTETLVRLQPLVAPMMHRVNVDVHYFFVPNRLIWSDFEKFITGGVQGVDAPVVPYMTLLNGAPPGSLGDYLGIPTPGAAGSGTKVTTLPYRAYQLIYNEYYRDQNLDTQIPISTASGAEAEWAQISTLRNRRWEKDYFTSALPWTQRGAPVTIPVVGDSQVVVSDSTNYPLLKNASGTALTGSVSTNSSGLQVGSTNTYIDPNGTLETNLNAQVLVEDVRKAAKLQQFLELAARVGSRYTEQLLGFFGVKSDDLRLHRPAYLGGGRTPILVSEIPQNSATGTTPQGNLAGHGISVGNTNKCSYYFKEHGYIFALMSIVPVTAYQQGIPKHFFTDDRFDLPWPQFAQLGEVPVTKGEIYATFNDDHDRRQVFGYQSRYADYKSYHSQVHGDFKTNLLNWHMGRVFATEPSLNTLFVQADPTHRVFAVTDPQYDKYLVNIYHNIQAKRPLPFFNNPSLL